MSEIHLITPTHDELMSVLVDDGFVHPFRFQPNVHIQVSYEEYLAFCKLLVQNNLEIMRFPLTIYSKAIDTRNEKTVRLFYFDMARAVLREVIMAIERDRQATIISLSFESCDKIIDFNRISEIVAALPEHEYKKGKELIEQEITCTLDFNTIPEHNRRILDYGIFLGACAFRIGDGTKVNIYSKGGY